MPTTIIVPHARPPIPAYNRTHWKVDVQARVIGGFADIAAHMAGHKFRQAAHRHIDHNAPATDTVLEVAPTGGPHGSSVWWESSPFATHVAVVVGYQCFAESDTPKLTITLTKRDDTGVDDDGIVWTTANGGLQESRQVLRLDPGPTTVYRYPILYTSTTGRLVDPAEIAGETAPRLANVGTEAGNIIKIKAEIEWGRLHFLGAYEALSETLTQ
jgi:hypothetical protein